MLQNSLQPVINRPTRILPTCKPSLIDNIFTNILDMNIISGNLTSKISDHCPNFMIAQGLRMNGKLFNRTVRDYSKFCEEKFKHDVGSIDISSYLVSDNVNEIFGMYNKKTHFNY